MRMDDNESMIQKYLKQYQILHFFDDRPISFFLICYEKGETLIHPLKKTDYLQFIVDGEIDIYHIRKDGSEYLLASGNDLTLLGDMEFVINKEPDFFAEAKSEVTALCINLEEYKKRLSDDVIFLNYLLKSLASKVTMASTGQAAFINLEEKVFHYILKNCPCHRLEHVEKTAMILHCSRRQLQRVLKQMVEMGRLTKVRKGVYEINQGFRN